MNKRKESDPGLRAVDGDFYSLPGTLVPEGTELSNTLLHNTRVHIYTFADLHTQFINFPFKGWAKTKGEKKS